MGAPEELSLRACRPAEAFAPTKIFGKIKILTRKQKFQPPLENNSTPSIRKLIWLVI